MATQPLLQADAADDEDLDDTAPAERDFEAEARSHGWVPKEEFKGDPTRWTDAETFAKRADEVMPLLKKQNQQQDRRIKDLEKQFRRASEHFSKAEERAYQRAVADLRREQEAAVETGDLEAHRAVSKKIDDLRAELPAKDVDEYTQEDVSSALKDFRRDNPWYDDEEGVMREYADLIAEKHVAKTKEMAPADFFTFIAERVKERFPDKKPERRQRLSAVEAPAGRPSRGQKTFNDLPQQAQQMCDKWVKSGLIKSREDYVKSYQWD